MNNKVSAVKASISVPVVEHSHFDLSRKNLTKRLNELGIKMSFSKFIRLVIYGWTLEKRPEGVYLTVNLSTEHEVDTVKV